MTHPIEAMLTEMFKRAVREVLAETQAVPVPDQRMTVAETARLMKRSRTGVLGLIRDKKLPAERDGRVIRVLQSDVYEYLEKLKRVRPLRRTA